MTFIQVIGAILAVCILGVLIAEIIFMRKEKNGDWK